MILPSVTWSEDEGTVTNLEGRIIKINQAQEPLGESKPDWQIQVELAERLGRGKYFSHLKTAKDVADEFRLPLKAAMPITTVLHGIKSTNKTAYFGRVKMKMIQEHHICS